jgi:hypothetical protein
VDGDRTLLQRGDQAEFSGFGRQHLRRAGLIRAAQKFPGDGARIVGIVETGVADAPALGLQRSGELAHGGEEEGDLLGVVGDVGRLVHHLRHDDRIAALVGLPQSRDLGGELIAEDEDKTAHQGISRPA